MNTANLPFPNSFQGTIKDKGIKEKEKYKIDKKIPETKPFGAIPGHSPAGVNE